LAINFTGEFDTPRCPDEVFDFLSDPNTFASLFPDFEGMTSQDATHFAIKLRVSVGNLSGSAELAMELAEAVRPQRALYKGAGTAVGSQIGMSAAFDLSAQPGGTRVAWQGEASIAGKLASLSPMLEPVVKQNLEKLIAALQWALYTASPGAAAEGTARETVQVPAVEAARSPTVPAENTSPVAKQPTPSQDLHPVPTPDEQLPPDRPDAQQPPPRLANKG
jgi:carbon monoxide dehydrogenase subunit G